MTIGMIDKKVTFQRRQTMPSKVFLVLKSFPFAGFPVDDGGSGYDDDSDGNNHSGVVFFFDRMVGCRSRCRGSTLCGYFYSNLSSSFSGQVTL